MYLSTSTEDFPEMYLSTFQVLYKLYLSTDVVQSTPARLWLGLVLELIILGTLSLYYYVHSITIHGQEKIIRIVLKSNGNGVQRVKSSRGFQWCIACMVRKAALSRVKRTSRVHKTWTTLEKKKILKQPDQLDLIMKHRFAPPPCFAEINESYKMPEWCRPRNSFFLFATKFKTR